MPATGVLAGRVGNDAVILARLEDGLHAIDGRCSHYGGPLGEGLRVGEGVGGADAEAGSGLRGLQDRLAVVDGVLSIESPPGGGTRLEARIPSPVAS